MSRPNGTAAPITCSGEFHPIVDAEHIVERGRHARRRQTRGHAFHLLAQLVGDLVGVQFGGPLDEEVVAHPDVLVGHLPVHPDRLRILVGDEKAVLEPARGR